MIWAISCLIMLQKLAFGLVAFARRRWKVGIFWQIFVKFAVFEMVTLEIWHGLIMCCCFFLESFILETQAENNIQISCFYRSWFFTKRVGTKWKQFLQPYHILALVTSIKMAAWRSPKVDYKYRNFWNWTAGVLTIEIQF